MYRVYFDTNEGNLEAGYNLWLDPSKKDLAAIPGDPREGMPVIIYMTGELEMEAVLAFSADQSAWIARPVTGTIKYFDS